MGIAVPVALLVVLGNLCVIRAQSGNSHQEIAQCVDDINQQVIISAYNLSFSVVSSAPTILTNWRTDSCGYAAASIANHIGEIQEVLQTSNSCVAAAPLYSNFGLELFASLPDACSFDCSTSLESCLAPFQLDFTTDSTTDLVSRTCSNITDIWVCKELLDGQIASFCGPGNVTIEQSYFTALFQCERQATVAFGGQCTSDIQCASEQACLPLSNGTTTCQCSASHPDCYQTNTTGYMRDPNDGNLEIVFDVTFVSSFDTSLVIQWLRTILASFSFVRIDSIMVRSTENGRFIKVSVDFERSDTQNDVSRMNDIIMYIVTIARVSAPAGFTISNVFYETGGLRVRIEDRCSMYAVFCGPGSTCMVENGINAVCTCPAEYRGPFCRTPAQGQGTFVDTVFTLELDIAYSATLFSDLSVTGVAVTEFLRNSITTALGNFAGFVSVESISFQASSTGTYCLITIRSRGSDVTVFPSFFGTALLEYFVQGSVSVTVGSVQTSVLSVSVTSSSTGVSVVIQDKCSLLESLCENNGSCDYSTGLPICLCPHGFEGFFCETAKSTISLPTFRFLLEADFSTLTQAEQTQLLTSLESDVNLLFLAYPRFKGCASTVITEGSDTYLEFSCAFYRSSSVTTQSVRILGVTLITQSLSFFTSVVQTVNIQSSDFSFVVLTNSIDLCSLLDISCGGNGVCSAAQCMCNQGFMGESCELPVPVFQQGSIVFEFNLDFDVSLAGQITIDAVTTSIRSLFIEWLRQLTFVHEVNVTISGGNNSDSTVRISLLYNIVDTSKDETYFEAIIINTLLFYWNSRPTITVATVTYSLDLLVIIRDRIRVDAVGICDWVDALRLCGSGSCQSQGISFVCDCDPGYYGDHCELQYIADVTLCLEEILGCYPKTNPAFVTGDDDEDPCGTKLTAVRETCISQKTHQCTTSVRQYVTSVTLARKKQWTKACVEAKCLVPVRSVFGSIFSDFLDLGDNTFFCDPATNFEVDLDAAVVTCENFAFGQYKQVASFYRTLYKAICGPSAVCFDEMLVYCIDLSDLSPSSMANDICMNYTSTEACMTAVMDNCNNGTSLSYISAQAVLDHYRSTCDASCGYTGTKCISTHIPLDAVYPPVSYLCAKKTEIDVCLTQEMSPACSTTYSTEVTQITTNIDNMCKESICREAGHVCYRNITAVIATETDVEKRLVAICSYLSEAYQCLSSYNSQDCTEQTIFKKFSDLQSICTTSNDTTCYLDAFECLGNSSLGSLFLPSTSENSDNPFCEDSEEKKTCMLAARDTCSSPTSIAAAAVTTLHDSYSVGCTSECEETRVDSCYSGLESYLELSWTSPNVAKERHVCGSLDGNTCVSVLTQKCSRNSQTALTFVLSKTMLKAIEVPCVTIPTHPEIETGCTVQDVASCFTGFIGTAVSAYNQPDAADIETVCSAWSVFEGCYGSSTAACVSQDFLAAVNKTYSTLELWTHSLCFTDTCRVVEAAACMTRLSQTVADITHYYECSPYNKRNIDEDKCPDLSDMYDDDLYDELEPRYSEHVAEPASVITRSSKRGKGSRNSGSSSNSGSSRSSRSSRRSSSTRSNSMSKSRDSDALTAAFGSRGKTIRKTLPLIEEWYYKHYTYSAYPCTVDIDNDSDDDDEYDDYSFDTDTPGTRQKSQTPKSPSTKTPKSPSTKTPKSPSTKTPKSPSTKTPKSPSTKTPKSPSTKTPKSPSTKTPKSPSTKTPKSPSTKTPKSPSTKTPKSPSTKTPKSPSTKTPKSPSTKTPKSPSTKTPKSHEKDYVCLQPGEVPDFMGQRFKCKPIWMTFGDYGDDDDYTRITSPSSRNSEHTSGTKRDKFTTTTGDKRSPGGTSSTDTGTPSTNSDDKASPGGTSSTDTGTPSTNSDDKASPGGTSSTDTGTPSTSSDDTGSTGSTDKSSPERSSQTNSGGKASQESRIVSMCEPKFEWGILCKTLNATRHCIMNASASCLPSLADLTKYSFHKQSGKLQHLCAAFPTDISIGKSCLGSIIGGLFSYTSYNSDKRQELCSDIPLLKKCVEKHFFTATPYTRKMFKGMVNTMLRLLINKCKADLTPTTGAPVFQDDFMPRDYTARPASLECGLRPLYEAIHDHTKELINDTLVIDFDKDAVCRKQTELVGQLGPLFTSLGADSYCGPRTELVSSMESKYEIFADVVCAPVGCNIDEAYDFLAKLKFYASYEIDRTDKETDKKTTSNGKGTMKKGSNNNTPKSSEIVVDFDFTELDIDLTFCDFARATLVGVTRSTHGCTQATKDSFHTSLNQDIANYQTSLEDTEKCYEACASMPCHNDGHCANEKDGSFTCTCRSGFQGTYCEQELCMYKDAVSCARDIFLSTVDAIKSFNDSLSDQFPLFSSTCSATTATLSCVQTKTDFCPPGRRTHSQPLADAVSELDLFCTDSNPLASCSSTDFSILQSCASAMGTVTSDSDNFCQKVEALRACITSDPTCILPLAFFSNALCPALECNQVNAAICLDTLDQQIWDYNTYYKRNASACASNDQGCSNPLSIDIDIPGISKARRRYGNQRRDPATPRHNDAASRRRRSTDEAGLAAYFISEQPIVPDTSGICWYAENTRRCVQLSTSQCENSVITSFNTTFYDMTSSLEAECSTTCEDNPCLNGGSCTVPSGGFGYVCDCLDGYEGALCERGGQCDRQLAHSCVVQVHEHIETYRNGIIDGDSSWRDSVCNASSLSDVTRCMAVHLRPCGDVYADVFSISYLFLQQIQEQCDTSSTAPDSQSVCVFNLTTSCLGELSFTGPSFSLTGVSQMCSSLQVTKTCLGSIDAVCSAGASNHKIYKSIEEILDVTEEVFCPVIGCNRLNALLCIESLQTVMRTASLPIQYNYCVDDDETDQEECKKEFLCRAVDYTRRCVELNITSCPTEKAGTVRAALTKITASAPDECSSQCEMLNPCLNGGTCQDAYPGFICTCDEAFTGPTCEEEAGCAVEQAEKCLDDAENIIASFLLSECPVYISSCDLLGEKESCVSRYSQDCEGNLQDRLSSIISVLAILKQQCADNAVDDSSGSSSGSLTCYSCKGPACEDFDKDSYKTCKEHEVCETVTEEKKGKEPSVEKRGCKNKAACTAGPTGRSGKCQHCCTTDYCNDHSADDQCVSTTGGQTSNDTCSPQPEACGIPEISLKLRLFLRMVFTAYGQRYGVQMAPICSSLSELRIFIGAKLPACDEDMRNRLAGLDSYLIGFTNNRCDSGCFEQESRECLAAIDTALNSYSLITSPTSSVTFSFCYTEILAIEACVQSNVEVCDDSIKLSISGSLNAKLSTIAATCPFPCASSPCSNNGTCVPSTRNVTEFSCICTPDFVGERCDTQNNLLPYGEDAGDEKLSFLGLGITSRTYGFNGTISSSFLNRFYISQYGAIFSKPVINNRFRQFSFGDNDVVAILYADWDLSCGGSVYFHHYTSGKGYNDIISRCNSDIFQIEASFQASSAIVITYHNVMPSPCSLISKYYPEIKPSSFQLVIASNGETAFTISRYQVVDISFRYRYAAIGYNIRGGRSDVSTASYSEVLQQYQTKPGNIGLPGRHVVKLYDDTTQIDPDVKCNIWINSMPDLRPHVSKFSPCPCNIDQLYAGPRTIWSKYTKYPFRQCFESRKKTFLYGPYTAQHTCCYNSITSSLIVRSSGRGLMQLVSGTDISHEEAYQACCEEGSGKLCNVFMGLLPSVGCRGFWPGLAGFVFGDPHMTTLDGQQYTFNGYGEYILLKYYGEEGHLFEVQARMQPMRSFDGATVFTGVVASMQGRDRVQVEANEDRTGLLLFINNVNETRFLLTNDSTISTESLTVSKNDGQSTSLILIFSEGWSVNVTLMREQLAIQLVVPRAAFGLTEGLLGNYNGDPHDDIQVRDGTILPHTASDDEIFQLFNNGWRVEKERSLFLYHSNSSWETKNDETYEPVIQPCTPETANEAASICGTNKACIFDYCITEDAEFALTTLTSQNEFMHRLSVLDNSAPVVDGPTIVKAVINETVSFQLTATDDDGDDVTFEMLGSIDATFNESGHFSWMPKTLDSVELSFVARDSNNGVSMQHELTIVLCSGCNKNGICDFEAPYSVSDNVLFQVAVCLCQVGYTGHDCELEYNGCDNNPCFGASCRDLTPLEEAETGRAYECGTCPSGYETENGICIDVDECALDTDNCDQGCINLIGGYLCTCSDRYRLEGDYYCQDIDECEEGTHDCEQKCENTAGSYSCVCFTDFTQLPDGSCQRNTACPSSLACSYTCAFISGQYTCICELGRRLVQDGITCEDIDECAEDTHRCDEDAVCLNTDKSYVCLCPRGSKLAADGRNCVECPSGTYGDNCEQTCSCAFGMRCDRVDGCVVMENACATANRCPDDHESCVSNGASYTCVCDRGYVRNDADVCILDEERLVFVTGGRFVVIKIAITLPYDSNLDNIQSQAAIDLINLLTPAMTAFFAGHASFERVVINNFYQSSTGFNVVAFFNEELTEEELVNVLLVFADLDTLTVGGNQYATAGSPLVVFRDDEVAVTSSCSITDYLGLCTLNGYCLEENGKPKCRCKEGYAGDDCEKIESNVMKLVLISVGCALGVTVVALIACICVERKRKARRPRGHYRSNLSESVSVEGLVKETYKPSPAYHSSWPSNDNHGYVSTVYHSADGTPTPQSMQIQPTHTQVPHVGPTRVYHTDA